MPSKNFYFDIIRTILDRLILGYAEREQKSTSQLDTEIAAHIQKTSSEYRNPDPNIDYNDPLCRLGYLFKHAGANATLFEKTLDKSAHLKNLLSQDARQSIHVCTVGGGPGTELLGLTKFLLSTSVLIPNISFTVLDQVPQWGETWNEISRACEIAFSSNANVPPTISKAFYPMNVVEESSYKNYGWLFQNVDMMVFNYLLSENQVSLQPFRSALDEMVQRTEAGCYFIVIDRLEYNSSFREEVQGIFDSSGLAIRNNIEIGTQPADLTVSDDNSALQCYSTRFKSNPRRWFSTPQPHRNPTVFALVAQKL